MCARAKTRALEDGGRRLGGGLDYRNRLRAFLERTRDLKYPLRIATG